jgi:hypothetical protein
LGTRRRNRVCSRFFPNLLSSQPLRMGRLKAENSWKAVFFIGSDGPYPRSLFLVLHYADGCSTIPFRQVLLFRGWVKEQPEAGDSAETSINRLLNGSSFERSRSQRYCRDPLRGGSLYRQRSISRAENRFTTFPDVVDIRRVPGYGPSLQLTLTAHGCSTGS